MREAVAFFLVAIRFRKGMKAAMGIGTGSMVGEKAAAADLGAGLDEATGQAGCLAQVICAT